MSHIARLFVDVPLLEGAEIVLPEAQSKYLIRVMRMPDGAAVRAFNGADGEWRCELRVQGKSAALLPKAQTREHVSVPDLSLVFAPIKKARTDFIIEKATELGVRTIRPVITEYTQTHRVRTDRMRALAIEAAEQTERLGLPDITDVETLPNLLNAWDPNIPLIYCDEEASALPLSQYQEQLINSPAGVLVGPEGGFSPNERKMLRELAFVLPISLGPRILRAETAVVSALTLWQSQVGDWHKAPYLPQT